MLTLSTRPLTADEKQQLAARLPTRYARAESFVLKLVFIVPVLLVPLLLLDHYRPVAARTQGVSVLLLVAVAFALVYWITRQYEGFSNRAALAAIAAAEAEVAHVCTQRAVERADPEDFGTAFYLEVQMLGATKLLYLQGQYLDELGEGIFPNTEFELTRRTDTREVLSLRLLGQPFQPEHVLPAFPMEFWRSGATPEDGDVLDDKLEAPTA